MYKSLILRMASGAADLGKKGSACAGRPECLFINQEGQKKKRPHQLPGGAASNQASFIPRRVPGMSDQAQSLQSSLRSTFVFEPMPTLAMASRPCNMDSIPNPVEHGEKSILRRWGHRQRPYGEDRYQAQAIDVFP